MPPYTLWGTLTTFQSQFTTLKYVTAYRYFLLTTVLLFSIRQLSAFYENGYEITANL